MTFLDRTITILATATLTSAVWIVAGGSLIEMADSESQRDVTRPAEAVPSPEPTVPEPAEVADNLAKADPRAALLDKDEASQPAASETRELMIPVLNVRASDLTDTFSSANGEGKALHEALDIMAPVGTSVRAASPGTVEKLFTSDAGGLTIYVRSADRKTIHYYAHLGEYADGLKEGQRIRRGQRLGTVGVSGNASPDTPHLHFAILRTTESAEWWEPASAVNPYPLFTAQ